MASRVIEAGTVIERTRFLLATRVLKKRPLWIDVAEAFPPIEQLPPRHKARDLHYGRAKKLSYTEDSLRRYFHMHYSIVTKESPASTEEVFSLCEGESKTTIALDMIDHFVRKQGEEVSLGKSKIEAGKSAMVATNDVHTTLQIKEKERVKRNVAEQDTTPLEKVVFDVIESLNRH